MNEPTRGEPWLTGDLWRVGDTIWVVRSANSPKGTVTVSFVDDLGLAAPDQRESILAYVIDHPQDEVGPSRTVAAAFLAAHCRKVGHWRRGVVCGR